MESRKLLLFTSALFVYPHANPLSQVYEISGHENGFAKSFHLKVIENLKIGDYDVFLKLKTYYVDK